MTTHVEADPVEALSVDENDLDSTYDETLSSTSSITSSVYAYEIEHGRSYHAYKAGQYVLPNDEDEKDRMDIQYHAIRLVFDDKAFLAPIGDNPQAILDVGTGTGIWCMDVGDLYPSAKVIGTDLSPIQPPFVPPNVQFEISDCTDVPWSYKTDTFDLINTRIMTGLGIKDWPSFYKEAFRCIKPGGYIESQECSLVALSDDNSIPVDSAILQWASCMVTGAAMGGIKLTLDPKDLEDAMKAAGFVDVVIKSFKMPIGLWPADKRLREAGKFQLGAMLHGLHGMSVAIFTRFLKWTLEDVEIQLARTRQEWRTRRLHSYYMMYSVYARKPLEASESGEGINGTAD